MHPSDEDDDQNLGELSDQKWLAARTPGAQVVQKHYVRARVHEINTIMGDANRNATIDVLMTDLSARLSGSWSKKKKRKYCAKVYDVLTSALQARDLTINLNPFSWFSRENRYPTYSQMYERAIDSTSGEMLLTDADPVNPAQTRARADDRITFPQHWTSQSGSDRHQNQPAVARGRGPAIQPFQSITSHMLTGTAIPKYGPTPQNDRYMASSTTSAGTVVYKSKNPKFDPRTKQVFSALNYGRRPHGSNTMYGMCHLVLNPALKVDAIYFPGDTFYIESAEKQASYQTLATLYLHAKPNIRALFLQSCLEGISQGDSREATEMVEAHIFSVLKFAGNVSKLHLDLTDEDWSNYVKTAAAPILPRDDQRIVTNATKFCRLWGIELKGV